MNAMFNFSKMEDLGVKDNIQKQQSFRPSKDNTSKDNKAPDTTAEVMPRVTSCRSGLG
jgi:hypothetical protein